jgi:putative flippase GtrA
MFCKLAVNVYRVKSNISFVKEGATKMLGHVMRTSPVMKSACVGGGAFIVDWSILYMVTHFSHLHYLIGATLGFICGLVINYIFTVSWVFTSHTVSSRYVEVLIFTLIGMIGLLMNDLLIFLLTEQIGIEYLNSKLLTSGIVFFWNYYARKYSLFSREETNIGGILHVG